MGFDSIWHWGLLLLIVLLIFGTRKIGGVGADLGNAVRGFRQAMRGDDEDKPAATPSGQARADPSSLQADAGTRTERDAE